MINTNIIQYIAITGSILFFIMILYLVRKKRIREEYSILWLFFGIIFIVLSIWRDILDYFARLIGIAYSPAAFLLMLIGGIILILIQYSIVISSLTEKNKNLTQELGILKLELENLKKQIDKEL